MGDDDDEWLRHCDGVSLILARHVATMPMRGKTFAGVTATGDYAQSLSVGRARVLLF
jgi:hypothetical protein